MTKKHFLYCIIFQVFLYLLLYLLTPMFISRFGLNGTLFGGIAELFQMVILNLLLIISLCLIFAIKFTHKIICPFFSIPIYFVMHMVMFNIDFRYSSLIGFGNFDIDIFLLITFILQLIIFTIVKSTKLRK